MENNLSPILPSLEQREDMHLQENMNGHNNPNQHQEIDASDTVSVQFKGLVPCVGMEFDTMDDARNFYEGYGRQEGFFVRIRSSYKGRWRSDETTGVIFVCNHEGKYDNSSDKAVKKRACSTAKCECTASLRVSLDKWTGKWVVKHFEDTHNHKIVSPNKRMKMMSNRKLPKAAKDLAELFHKENLPPGKVESILGGEQIGFDARAVYNHLRDVRHRELEKGDAQSVLSYFRNMQAKNPQFFYSLQCDDNGRATNFFWVDARSRLAYQYFGDVVTFDTTYRTNKYDMPFAPFTGVNHHFQSIQFGCALLQDETEPTFVWLFETWLEAMGGRAPISIITDQDPAMKGAIAKVFPNTRHRLCFWHIKKKFVEKLSQVYYKKSKFKYDMKKLLLDTYTVEIFEDRWEKIMSVYGLQDNAWLRDLYKIRELWVPVYNRNTFYAGMNTTSRSEGANSFFDDFVTSTTNLREFVVKYEQALKKIVKKETDEDYISEHKFRIVAENQFLLKHAAKTYTRKIFNKFQIEFDENFMYKLEEGGSEGEYSIFFVTKKTGEGHKFLVKLNLRTLEGHCECKYFEFIGILCRHLLKVFCRYDIDEIPNHFILPRWKQEANKFRRIDGDELMKIESSEESDAMMLSYLCQEATKVACFASQSKKFAKIFVEGLNKISSEFSKLKIEEVGKSGQIGLQGTLDSQSHNENVNAAKELLLDPHISRTKGRKKDSERIKSGLEIGAEKKKRQCKTCQKHGHNSRTCSLNLKNLPISEESDDDE